MKYMHSEWQKRLDHWLVTLKQDLYLPLGNIDVESYFTMDYLTPEEALKGDFQPMAVGTEWGHTWEYCWMKGRITLPKEAEGKRIVMDLHTGGETTIFVDGTGAIVGEPVVGAYVDGYKQFVEDYLNALP